MPSSRKPPVNLPPVMKRSIVSAIMLSTLLLSGAALGDEGEGAETPESAETEVEALADVIRVIQQRPNIRAGRLEIQTLFGLGLADTMFRHKAPVLNARYHITERWSVGGSGAYYFPDTHGFDAPLSSTSATFDDVTATFELFPEKAVIEWFAGIDAAFIPIDGKFALFNRHIFYFDFYLVAGGGVIQTSRSATPKPVGVVGIGWRLAFNRWLALNLEFRDHLYVENYNAGDEFVNHVMFQAGLSWWFPFDFEYRFPR